MLVCDALCQPLNYSTLKKRMSSLLQEKSTLALFCFANFSLVDVFYEILAFVVMHLAIFLVSFEIHFQAIFENLLTFCIIESIF